MSFKKTLKRQQEILEAAADAAGWEICEGPIQAKGGHWRWTLKRGDATTKVTGCVSPSDHRSLLNWRSQLRRQLA